MSIGNELLSKSDRLNAILANYGLAFDTVTQFVDSSHGNEDQRYSFILDNRYVLKINSSTSVWETRLQGIRRLIDRYRSIGVYCPQLISALDGCLCVPLTDGNLSFNCYLEEFSRYPCCGETNIPERREIVAHLGTLAARYTNVDLSDVYSMWSILDLSPLDRPCGKDEKQENAEALINALYAAGESELAESVSCFNKTLRESISSEFRLLPRCVFQGDLNLSNVLVDHGHFAGLIDFNLSGTDVNINVFVNETNWFPEEADFDQMTVFEMMEAIEQRQAELLTVILERYRLCDLEELLLPAYRSICDLFQFPNVCALRKWLKEPLRKAKAAELISALCARTQ